MPDVEERKLCLLRCYANCVSTTLTVLILHNVESVYFFYSNPVYDFYEKIEGSEFINCIVFQNMPQVGRGINRIILIIFLAKYFTQFCLLCIMYHFVNPEFNFNYYYYYYYYYYSFDHTQYSHRVS